MVLEHKAVTITNSRKQQRIDQGSIAIANDVAILTSRRVQLKICARYFTGRSRLVPPLTHSSELRIIRWSNCPDATTMPRLVIGIPQDEEQKRRIVKIRHAVGVNRVRPRFDYSVETRGVDRLPRVGALDVRAVRQIGALLALNAVDPRKDAHDNLRPSPSIHRNRMAGPARYFRDRIERFVMMIEKTEGNVNDCRPIVVHIP